MRDLETIAIAIETAETGHLVFGTLHTTTAVSTVDRIIDQFPTDRQEQIRVMLSESLKGVIAQTLCQKIGGGRVAAHEILLGNHAVASLIREGKTFQLASVMQTSKAPGHGHDERLAPRARSEEARRPEAGVDQGGRQVRSRDDVQERRDSASDHLTQEAAMGFLICKSCERHVRQDEKACPFCGGTSLEGTRRVARRLSRGAMIGAAAVAIACSSTSPGDDGGTDAAQDTGSDTLQAAYGGPPFDASALDSAPKDAAPDSPVAAYGGPPTDAGDG